MPSTIAGATAVKDVLAELESLGDEKRRQYNAKVGPDGIAGAPPDKQFGCKTGDIRKLAKKIKTDHELGQKLWKTGNMDAQLLAILIMKPKELSAKQLDTMVREARFAWVVEWLQSYIIKDQPDDEKEKLREKWMKKNERDSWAARPVIGVQENRLGAAEFVSWAEFYLPQAGWVPFDPAQMRSKGIRHLDVRQPWPEFGTMKNLNRRIPLAYHFTPPATVQTPQAPAVWGWNPRPGGDPSSEQQIRFTMISRGRGPDDPG